MITAPLPEQIELHRDRMWRREEELRVESAVDAERSSKMWALQTANENGMASAFIGIRHFKY